MMCPDLPRSQSPKFRHFYKYNFMTLLSARPVIEFRQHEGTLNANEIVRWVRFVGALVSLAHNIDIQNLARLAHLNDDKPVNFTELARRCRRLGLARARYPGCAVVHAEDPRPGWTDA
jgi:hypothetical protein